MRDLFLPTKEMYIVGNEARSNREHIGYFREPRTDALFILTFSDEWKRGNASASLVENEYA